MAKTDNLKDYLQDLYNVISQKINTQEPINAQQFSAKIELLKPNNYILPVGNIDISSTAEIDVTNYATAKVVDSNLLAENIKNGVKILGITGTMSNSSIKGITGSNEHISIDGSDLKDINIRDNNIVITSSGKDIQYRISGDCSIYYSSGVVTTSGLLAENIKKGVTILGIEGSCEGGNGAEEGDLVYTPAPSGEYKNIDQLLKDGTMIKYQDNYYVLKDKIDQIDFTSYDSLVASNLILEEEI